VPVSYLATLSQQIETPSVLTFEEQSRLVVELKRGLRDPATFQDSRDLLGRLRARRDLLATIAEEIDEVVVREPKGLRRASRINLRPAAIPLSWESSHAFVETPRPGRLDGIRVISWLWGWMSSDPSTLRRVAQQKILAHWLVLLIPVLLYQLRFWGSYVFVVGLSLASGLIIGIVSIYLFRNPIPTLGGILTFVSLCFAPISVPGLHEATPFLGCVVISGSLSQWVIQRARRRLAVLP
jgi:hypothetical protein